MLKLGTFGIKTMYLGGSKIAKAYLGTDLVHDAIGGTPSVLPYDAEIEYLQSSGTQYIDTGIIPTADTGIYTHVISSSTATAFVAGQRNDSGNTRWGIVYTGTYYYEYATDIPSSVTNADVEVKLNWLNDKNGYASGGNTTHNTPLPTLNFSPANNIRLFGAAGMTGATYSWSGKISFFKVSQGSDIVMDLIPVRVGQTGYMYDKVSGQLFGNDGSGDFIIGNDITQ